MLSSGNIKHRRCMSMLRSYFSRVFLNVQDWKEQSSYLEKLSMIQMQWPHPCLHRQLAHLWPYHQIHTRQVANHPQVCCFWTTYFVLGSLNKATQRSSKTLAQINDVYEEESNKEKENPGEPSAAAAVICNVEAHDQGHQPWKHAAVGLSPTVHSSNEAYFNKGYDERHMKCD